MAINLNNAESSTSVWGMTRAIDVEVPSFVFNKQTVRIEKTGNIIAPDGKESVFLGSYGQHHTNALVFDLSALETDISKYYQQCVFQHTDTKEKLTIRFKNNYLLIPDNLTKKPGEYEIIFMLIERGDQGNIENIENTDTGEYIDTTEYFISNKFSGRIDYPVKGGEVTEEQEFLFTKENINSYEVDQLISVTNTVLNKTDNISLAFNASQQLDKIEPTLGNKLDSLVKIIDVTKLWENNPLNAMNWFLISNKNGSITKYQIEKPSEETPEIKYWIPKEWTGTEEPVNLAFGFYGIEQGKEYFYITNFILLKIGENWLEENDFNFDISNNWVILSSTETDDEGNITNPILYDMNGAMLQASDD